MNTITTLRTLKGKPLEEQERTLQSILDIRPNLGKQVRSYVEGQINSSIFTVKASVSDLYFARIVLLLILLADIATIPDRNARESYMISFRELCREYEIKEVDIEFLAKYTSGFENILENQD